MQRGGDKGVRPAHKEKTTATHSRAEDLDREYDIRKLMEVVHCEDILTDFRRVATRRRLSSDNLRFATAVCAALLLST